MCRRLKVMVRPFRHEGYGIGDTVSFKFLNVTHRWFRSAPSGESPNGNGAKLPNNAWLVFQLAARTSCPDVGRKLEELVVWLIHDSDIAFGAVGAVLFNRCSIVEDAVRRSS
jgi:hypothetical protein